MSNCLITGVAGFIGSHLAETLLQRGDTVIGLDSFDPFYDPALKHRNLATALRSDRFHLYRGDIRDEALVTSLFSDHKPEAVVHLAAKAGVRPSLDAPAEYMDVNVRGTAVILEAARRHDVNRFVFASSSSVYGGANKLPFQEDQIVASPLSPYAASKIAGEALCHAYHHLYKMCIVSLRFFTVYGPRQRPDLAINKFRRQIMAGEPLTIYGDGSASRDYTYVADIVAGICAAVDAALAYDVINLGNSAPVTVNELAQLMEQAMGRSVGVQRLDCQPGDMPHTYASIARAGNRLGWQPKMSLEAGLREFVAWAAAEAL
jgi:UDP-glucuronate 4-epimerase